MKKYLFILIAALAGSYYFYYHQNSTVQQPNNFLVIGTSADYPPYEKIDLATGKIVGFDIDIIAEIARRLGKQIQLKDMPFNALMLNLITGQIDMIAAGLSQTQDRKESVLFSDVYLDNDYMVIVTKTDKPTLQSIEDLYGKTVAVNTGYNAENYLATMPEISLVRLESTADSALALQANSVDAFATSKSSYSIFIEQQENKNAYQYFIVPQVTELCAFAFAKNNSSLKEQIDLTLQEMKQDGNLQTIKKSWGFND